MSEPHEATAVEAAPVPTTLHELQVLLATKEQEAETLTATLGEMWQQRQQGKLPREKYTDYLYFEDQLRVTLQKLELLDPKLAYARAVDAITTAVSKGLGGRIDV